MRDFGLLLTPEIAHWEYPHANGTPPRTADMIQRRASFTELAPQELARHSDEFGHFALEFEADTLKQLGAMPVFYVPRSEKGAGSLADTMVMMIIDAMRLTDRIGKVSPVLDEAVAANRPMVRATFGTTDNTKVFELNPAHSQETLAGIGHALAPSNMLSSFLEAALNYFYPADGRNNEALKYYRQREWRISGNYTINGEEVMCLPSTALIERLIQLDGDFFGRTFPPKELIIANKSIRDSSPKRLADWVYVLPTIGGRHILEFARRIVVPDGAVEQARKVLSLLAHPPPVVGISSLSASHSAT